MASEQIIKIHNNFKNHFDNTFEKLLNKVLTCGDPKIGKKTRKIYDQIDYLCFEMLNIINDDNNDIDDNDDETLQQIIKNYIPFMMNEYLSTK